MTDKNLCILPWISLYIRADGNIYPCESVAWQNSEYFLGNLNDVTLEEVWNHEIMKSLRLKILKTGTCELSNVEKNSCMYLINHELYKDTYLSYNSDTLKDGSYPFNLKSLFLERSNHCNLKCVYCCDLSSTLWEKAKKTSILKISDKVYDEKILPHLKNLKELFLSGGEPVINKYNLKILKYLHEHNPAIEIGMATNLTYNLDTYREFFDLLTGLNNTKIFCSVDSTHHRHELIRTNSNWAVVEKNLNILKLYKTRLYFNSVISILSVFYIQELHQYLLQNNVVGIDGIRYINLTGPEELNIQNLSLEKKIELKAYLTEYKQFLIQEEKKINKIDMYPNNNLPSEAVNNIILYLFRRKGSKNYLSKLKNILSTKQIEQTFPKLI